MKMLLRIAVLLSCLQLIAAQAFAEMTIWEEVRMVGGEMRSPSADDNIERKYDRFFIESSNNAETHSTWIGIGPNASDPWDWTGVGRGTVANHWGTAIGGKFYVTAEHAEPTTSNNSLRFFTALGSGAKHIHSVTRTISSAGRANPSYDRSLGSLTTSVPDTVATYPILLYPNKSSYVGRDVYMWGHSLHTDTTCSTVIIGQAIPDGWPGFSQSNDFSMKIGRNTISDYEATNSLGKLERIFMKYETGGTSAQGKAEAFYRNGSSGGPVFSFYAGKPCLVGLAWGVNGLNRNSPGSHGCTPIAEFDSNGNAVDGKAPPNNYESWASTFDRQWLHDKLTELQSGVPLHERIRAIYRTTTYCDFDGDFSRDADDLDIIVREAYQRGLGNARGYNWYLDVNGDGSITDADVTSVLGVFGNSPGDANLDGSVNNADRVIMLNNMVGTGKGWLNGDFTGDGKVDDKDFLIYDAND